MDILNPLSLWPPFTPVPGSGAGGVRNPLSNIYSFYESVMNRARDGARLGPANCLITVDTPPEWFPKAQSPFVTLNPGARSARKEQVDGGGRYVSGEYGSFRLNLFIRSLTDSSQEHYHTTISSNFNIGIFALEKQIFESLETYFPLDQNGSPLAEEPIRWVSSTEPQREKRGGEWVYVTQQWEFSLARDFEDFLI